MAVIHQLFQYNGLSKGPIFQLKHLHCAVPSRAPYHCITFPVIHQTLLHSRAERWLGETVVYSQSWKLKWLCLPRWQRWRLSLLIRQAWCMQRTCMNAAKKKKIKKPIHYQTYIEKDKTQQRKNKQVSPYFHHASAGTQANTGRQTKQTLKDGGFG